MPAKAVTMTKEDEDIFLHDKIEQDNGVISHKNTPTFTNYTTKNYSSLTGTNKIVETGIKTFSTS